MPSNITLDEVLGAGDPNTAITAQEVIDLVPRNPQMQPQIVDTQGRDVQPLDFEYANSPQDLPKVAGVEQRPTGHDQNVLPGSAGFKGNFKAGWVEDPRTQIGIVARQLFPDDPQATRRFGIRDGKIVYIDDDLNIRDVDSGVLSKLGGITAYAPEGIGTAIGSLATGNPVSGSAIGAMGGKAIKQMTGALVFDEPQTTSGNVKGMAAEGAATLATGGLAKGAGKFVNKGKVVDFTPAERVAAEATREGVQRTTGITLDIAQASGDPVLMSLRKYASKFPGESAQIFKAVDELQTGQSADAMQKLIATVGKAQSSEAAGAAGINGAEAAIRAARAGVSKQVKPLYDAAYAAVPEITDKKILGMLQLPYFQQAYKAGQRIAVLEDRAAGKAVELSKTSSREKVRDGLYRTVEKVEKKTVEKPDLRALDYTKRALDDQIESLKQGGNRQAARALKVKRDEFVAAIDAIPNQQWQAARAKYGELAKSQLEPLENGAVGVLAKIKDGKAVTAAAKIFTDPNITAKEIAFSRQAIEKADPEAWSGLAQQYLGTILNNSLKVTQKGETVNLAGKLYQAMAGTPEQAAKLRAALPAGSQQLATDTLDALKLVAATERAGSDTAFNQLVTRKIEGRFATTLKALRQPVQTAIASGEQRSLEKLVANLAHGLTDPARVSQLRQVTKASPGMERALVILGNLTVTPAERAAINEAFPMADQPIPALQKR